MPRSRRVVPAAAARPIAAPRPASRTASARSEAAHRGGGRAKRHPDRDSRDLAAGRTPPSRHRGQSSRAAGRRSQDAEKEGVEPGASQWRVEHLGEVRDAHDVNVRIDSLDSSARATRPGRAPPWFEGPASRRSFETARREDRALAAVLPDRGNGFGRQRRQIVYHSGPIVREVAHFQPLADGILPGPCPNCDVFTDDRDFR